MPPVHENDDSENVENCIAVFYNNIFSFEFQDREKIFFFYKKARLSSMPFIAGTLQKKLKIEIFSRRIHKSSGRYGIICTEERTRLQET